MEHLERDSYATCSGGSAFPRRRPGGRFGGALLALLLCLGAAAAQGRGVDSASYPEAVRLLMARGVLGGSGDDDLELGRDLTRAELLALLHRLAGAPAQSGGRCFADVEPGAWYAGAVCWGDTAGVVSGYPDGTFRPDRPVGRAEAIAALLRARGEAWEPPAPGEPWYAQVMDHARSSGLTAGNADAATPLSRDEAVMLLFQDLRGRARSSGSALPSSGCAAVPQPLPERVRVGGRDRSFIAAAPNDGAAGPKAVVFAFHGRTSPAAQVQRYFRLEPHGDDTLFVYPRALPSEGGFRWSDPGDAHDDLRDYALFDALLDRLAGSRCLDLARVFVVGHSLGASFATSLACARGDRIRAVAALGGGVQAGSCRGRVAAMILHNPDDRLVPVAEGERARDLFVALNNLETDTVPTEPAALSCRRHLPLSSDFPVVWCPHGIDSTAAGRYYPHHWPAAAGEAIMDFFADLP